MMSSSPISSPINISVPPSASSSAILSDDHYSRVNKIQQFIANNRPEHKKITFSKRGFSHSIHNESYKKDDFYVDVTSLHHIEQITVCGNNDPIVAVEAEVTIGELCKHLLPYNLQPLVVPEHSTFTLSGLLNGGGIQSTSHIHGLFNESIAWCTVITAENKLLYCDSKVNSDLFYGLDSSKGTLAIVVAMGIKLIPSTNWIQSKYYHYTNLDDYIQGLQSHIKQQTMLDAVVYGRHSYVIVTAEFIDDKEKENLIELYNVPLYDEAIKAKRGDPFYYQYTEQVAKMTNSTRTKSTDSSTSNISNTNSSVYTDIMHTLDYWTRSVRGSYWLLEVYGGSLFCRNNLGRRYIQHSLERALKTNGFRDTGLTTAERERCIVIQDIGIELSRLKQGIQYVQNNLAVYPLWNCVIKTGHSPHPRLFGKDESTQHDETTVNFYPDRLNLKNYVVDIGIYGEPDSTKTGKIYRNQQELSALQRFLGFPSVWSTLYINQQELKEKFFNEDFYNGLRQKYSAEKWFHKILEKIVFFHNDNGNETSSALLVPDIGPIPAWRLYRAWKAGEYHILGALLLAALIVAFVALGLPIYVGYEAWSE